MDGERFDHLLKSLHVRSTRRLTLTAGGGVLTALLGRNKAAAKCVKAGKSCKGPNGTEKKCCGGAKCVGGKCRCTNRKKNSGGVCAKRPRCRGTQKPCATGADCCSKECAAIVNSCNSSTLGERCRDKFDCVGDATCIGFRCKKK